MNQTPIKHAFFALLLIGLLSSASIAKPRIDNSKTDKTTLKTRAAVSNASPNDWHTLAEAAERCIRKGVNMKEASQWLERSLEIKETAYNMSVKGDYYLANRLPQKALEFYAKSIELGKIEDPKYDPTPTQKKIASIVFK
jgi:hypothetical protein